MRAADPEPREDRVEDVVERFILARLRGDETDLDGLLGTLDETDSAEARRRIDAFEAIRSLAAPSPDGEPRVYGDFAIEGEIGRGGMGVVYRARQISLGRQVALKVLPSLAALEGRRTERFLREAAVLSRLEHEGIVPVLTAGEDRGTLYFAMPCVRGAGLDRVLEALDGIPLERRSGADIASVLRDAGVADTGDLERRSYVAAVVGIARRVADALAHAHTHGVVHRDVKPSNVILGEGGRPMLIDFGLAKGGEAGTLTGSLDLLGTPSYLPPECIAGSTETTEQGDVYSLGVLLYEMLCGRRPFEAETVVGLLGAIERGNFARPRSLARGLSRDLETICLKAMEFDPARRYASMVDLALDLRAFLEYRPIRARPAGPLRRARMLARRQPALAFASAVFLALAIGVPAAGTVRAAARGREANAAAREVRAAVAAGRLEQADRLLAHLTALDEGHPDGPALARAVDLARCERVLTEVAGSRAALDSFSRELDTLDPEILAREKRVGVEVTAESERHELARLRARREIVRTELEQRVIDVENALHLAETWAARAGVERHAPVQRAFADFHASRFRAARDAGDEIATEVERRLVRERDDEGRYADELLGLGALRVEIPLDARAFLFRYARIDRARPDQWLTRLVPVPFRDPPTGVEHDGALQPGDTCLELLEVAEGGGAHAAGLRAGDLVFEVDGCGLATALRVQEVLPGSRAAEEGIRVWDRIVSVNGVELWKLADLFEVESAGGPFDVVFESEGVLREVACHVPLDGIDQEPGVMPAGLPALVATVSPPRPIEVRVLRGSRELAFELPAGAVPLAVARTTAAPLLAGDEADLGSPPIAEEELSPGSYLLLVQQPGCRDLRVPFAVRPSETVRLQAHPKDAALAPSGCVWIPPGELRRGTDPMGTFSAGPELVQVDGFWVSIYELTMAEWWAFLDDPEVLDRIHARLEATGLLELVPRRESSQVGLFGELGARWSYEPVRGLAFSDIEAYLEHLNRRLGREGSPWIADVPSDVEWERAAAGADSRPYPWGRSFDPSLCANVFSKRSGFWEPVYAYPTDESPFGVHGLASSVSEWTSTLREDSDVPSRFIHGGSMQASASETFRIEARQADGPDRVKVDTGFRLVFRPRPGDE